jgi:hypothetical protein
MAAGYTKEFLVEAALSRFEILGMESVESLRIMFDKFYDEAGKDKFRKYTCLDAEAIKKYKEKW